MIIAFVCYLLLKFVVLSVGLSAIAICSLRFVDELGVGMGWWQE